jgi:hypothetical protein
LFDESRIVNRLLPASWRAVPGGLRLFVGIDRRRPASWITLAMGGWLGWWCAVATADQSGGIAMLAAAVLAVAAVGDIPLVFCLSAGRWRQFLWGCAWAFERAAWPFVGMMLGMLAAGGVPKSFEIVSAATAGALLAAVTTVASRLSGVKSADAASLVLLVAAASAATDAGADPAPAPPANRSSPPGWVGPAVRRQTHWRPTSGLRRCPRNSSHQFPGKARAKSEQTFAGKRQAQDSLMGPDSLPLELP